MSERNDYVRIDEYGVMRVGDTRVMLDSIVAAFEQGHSAETIQQQYPALSLEQVYGSITYYLANTQDVTQYLRRQGELWESWRSKSKSQASQLVERLRALRAAGAREPS